jgi:nucleotide-binding universal stress UspA family protein
MACATPAGARIVVPADVAQLVEHFTRNEGVPGSSPGVGSREAHVLHVVERDVLAGEDAVDLESDAAATELLEACIAELREAGVPVTCT